MRRVCGGVAVDGALHWELGGLVAVLVLLEDFSFKYNRGGLAPRWVCEVGV